MTAATNTPGPSESPYEQTMRIAVGLARFKNMDDIPLPVLTNLVKDMDILRLAGSLLTPGSAQDGMCVCLPPGVGKSTAARMMVRSSASRAGLPAEKGPVLLVTLDVEESVSLWSSLLRTLGDPYWAVGYPKNLKNRAIKLIAKRGVDLIIIDEFNHSVDRGQARLLMNTVKEILNAGLCPVVVMGTDDEIEKLPRNDAWERRMVHASVIGPLRWDSGEQEKCWKGFLKGLDKGIVDLDILTQRSGFGREDIAKALFDACDGVIGYAYWVVQDALTEVLKRNARTIERSDLAISVNRLFVKHELYDRLNAVEGLA